MGVVDTWLAAGCQRVCRVDFSHVALCYFVFSGGRSGCFAVTGSRGTYVVFILQIAWSWRGPRGIEDGGPTGQERRLTMPLICDFSSPLLFIFSCLIFRLHAGCCFYLRNFCFGRLVHLSQSRTHFLWLEAFIWSWTSA